jgi:hypothetical protein
VKRSLVVDRQKLAATEGWRVGSDQDPDPRFEDRSGNEERRGLA